MVIVLAMFLKVPVLESPPEPASRFSSLLGACKNAYFATSFEVVGLMAFSSEKNTTFMVGAFPNIISLKKNQKGRKAGIFDLGACEVARSLQARLAGSHGF